MDVRSLERGEIDDEKWDHCIATSAHSNVYGLTWYLDAVTERKWQALVSGDYDIVLPFLKKSKYFLPYITQPFLCQSFQMYTNTKYKDDFIIKSLQIFRNTNLKVTLNLNYPNFEILNKKNYSVLTKRNQILDLAKAYPLIKGNYNRSTLRNILKAESFDFKIINHDTTLENLQFIADFEPTGLVNKNFDKVSELCKKAIENKIGFYQVALDDTEIIAVAFYLFWNDRLIFLLSSVNEIGKKKRAMFKMLDSVIKEYSDQNVILDFAGSTIENVAMRNEGFGTIDEYYYQLSHSWLLR